MASYPTATMADDIRAVIGNEYRTVVSNYGFQAGAIAHLVHVDAEATLCGVPQASLAAYEDLDEPICPRCVEWLSRQPYCKKA